MKTYKKKKTESEERNFPFLVNYWRQESLRVTEERELRDGEDLLALRFSENKAGFWIFDCTEQACLPEFAAETERAVQEAQTDLPAVRCVTDFTRGTEQDGLARFSLRRAKRAGAGEEEHALLAFSLHRLGSEEASRTLSPKERGRWFHVEEKREALPAEARDGLHCLQLRIHLEKEDLLFGLGDPMAPLNRRGYRFTMWNTDDPSVQLEHRASLYKSVPILFKIHPKTKRCCVLFFDQSARSHFDLALCRENTLIYTTEARSLRLYVAEEEHFPAAYRRLVSWLGTNSLPPRSILGYHQSRWSYKDEAMVEELLQLFDQYRLPLSHVHLDIDYMEGFRNFSWSRERFPGAESLSRRLGEAGIGLIPILDAGMKLDPTYPPYCRGHERAVFLKEKALVPRRAEEDGADTGPSSSEPAVESGAPRENDEYVGRVWPGETVYPDFEQAEARRWWKEEVAAFVRRFRPAGIWLDMNEPANFNGDLPDELVTRSRDAGRQCGVTHRDWHNRFANQMALATREGICEANPKKRPFLFSRAAYAGIQAFAGVWTGDSISMWGELRMQVAQMLTLSFCGISLLSADIGGFGGHATEELFVRWFQWGSLMPFMRNHCELNGRFQEPWCFGERALRQCRDSLEFRYSMIPYIYDQMTETECGDRLPLLRCLALMHPDDDTAYQINDSFYWGRDFLAAPILDPGRAVRAVYLPKGAWYDYRTQVFYDCREGGRWILASAEDGSLPLFVRAGAMIPTWPRQGSEFWSFAERNSCDPGSCLELRAYPFPKDSTRAEREAYSYVHHLDSGDGFAYRRGEESRYEFRWGEEGLEAEVTIGSEGLSYDEIRVLFIDENEVYVKKANLSEREAAVPEEERWREEGSGRRAEGSRRDSDSEGKR